MLLTVKCMLKTRGRQVNNKKRYVLHFTDELSSTTAEASADRVGVNIGDCAGCGIGGGILGVTAIGFGIGFLVAMLLASIIFVILVRLRFLELHPRPANKPLGKIRLKKT